VQERQVMEFRYGLLGGEPHTLEEVERAFGVTRERIRQIEHDTLTKLEALEQDAAGPRRLPRWRRRPRRLARALTALRLPRLKRRPAVHGGRLLFDYPDEPEPEDGAGVREPRRPKLPSSSGAAALPLPEP
jgi:sigma-70-like protein